MLIGVSTNRCIRAHAVEVSMTLDNRNPLLWLAIACNHNKMSFMSDALVGVFRRDDDLRIQVVSTCLRD